jgi:hypothetical protein
MVDFALVADAVVMRNALAAGNPQLSRIAAVTIPTI